MKMISEAKSYADGIRETDRKMTTRKCRHGKKMGKITALCVVLVLTVLLCAGCAKENKYVNLGVEMSTAGMSLYLTNTVNGFQKISNYVFFAESSQDAIDKISLDKQGIDITYLPAKDLALIKPDSGLKVVFPDCFDADGMLKGVWVAKGSWLENAPNYSYRFILGLAKSADYRASHMNMSYADALESLKGVRDVDWQKYPEVMQYCAVYALSNKEELADEDFVAYDAAKMLEMFRDYASGSGEGYQVCDRAYARYCMPKSVWYESFEKMFDFSLAIRAFEEATKGE
ncbi:MAG: hypothetical protein J6Y89_00550 [Lachnospiraceae bacterium]|nr:hypothetical protein [Lachnospiraceae bacterium]